MNVAVSVCAWRMGGRAATVATCRATGTRMSGMDVDLFLGVGGDRSGVAWALPPPPTIPTARRGFCLAPDHSPFFHTRLPLTRLLRTAHISSTRARLTPRSRLRTLACNAPARSRIWRLRTRTRLARAYRSCCFFIALAFHLGSILNLLFRANAYEHTAGGSAHVFTSNRAPVPKVRLPALLRLFRSLLLLHRAAYITSSRAAFAVLAYTLYARNAPTKTCRWADGRWCTVGWHCYHSTPAQHLTQA